MSAADVTRRGLCAGVALVAAAGGALAATTAEHSADAEIIAAADRFIYLQGEYARLSRATDVPSNVPRTPKLAAMEAEFESVIAEEATLGEQLAAMVPRGAKGIHAKARAALAYLDPCALNGMIDRMQHSILSDIVGRA
jgi:hypothetical protein